MRTAICVGTVLFVLLIGGWKMALGVGIGYGVYALVDDRYNLGKAR